MPTLTCSTIVLAGSKAWVGIRHDGKAQRSLQQFAPFIVSPRFRFDVFTQADLDTDPLLQGRPIALVRVDGHASWVSPRVLELMGPIPSTVQGGTIMRDTHGNPSGTHSVILATPGYSASP